MKELLEELAAEARPYADAEPGVRVMRRRRRLLRATPFAVAAVVAASMILTYVSVSRPDDHGTPTTSVSWLPHQLTVNMVLPGPLPDNQAVGPAALLYQPGNNSPYVLVTPTGNRFRLTAGIAYSLSPDGRWLVSLLHRRIVVRDLLGTTTRDIGADTSIEFQAIWSSDSDLLAVQQGSGPVTVVDLPSGAVHPLPIPADHYVCGAQDAGDLLVCSRARVTGQGPTVSRIDARTGATKSTATLRIADALTSEEQTAQAVDPTAGIFVVPAAGAQTVLVRTARRDDAYDVTVPADLLELDVTTGELVTRFTLPREATGPMQPKNGAVSYAMAETRSLASALPDAGILLVHAGPLGGGDDAFVEAVWSVEVLDPITGNRAVAMTITGRARALVLRGQ